MTGNFDPNTTLPTSNEVVLSVSEKFALIEAQEAYMGETFEASSQIDWLSELEHFEHKYGLDGMNFY